MRCPSLHSLSLLIALFAALLLTLPFSLPAAAAEHLCSNYTYQEDAQARISDYPATLDPDGNGIACEQLPSRTAPQPTAAAPAPATIPSTGVGTTAHPTDRTPLLLLAALLALSGMVALRRRRHA